MRISTACDRRRTVADKTILPLLYESRGEKLEIVDGEINKRIEERIEAARAVGELACHGCLLVSETSCEQRNEFLDRALCVATVEALGAEFFG